MHIIIVYMDKCCKHSHKTPVINNAFPPLSFFSRDNSANRRSTSCPMSLKAPAACEFAGDWWRGDRKRREFLTRVSPLEIFNGHLYIYIWDIYKASKILGYGFGNIFTQYGLMWYSTFSLEVLKFHWNSIDIWWVSEEWTIFLRTLTSKLTDHVFKANFEDLNRLNWVEDISALVQLKTERNHLELGILIICPITCL